MNQYGYDSFVGPSLNLRPEELDRLDASQIEPLDPPSPSISFDASHYRNLEASIDRTMNALKGDRQNYCQQADSASTDNNFFGYQTSPPSGRKVTPVQSNDANINNNAILTPPSSQPNVHSNDKVSLVEMLRAERDKAVADMQRICDQRVETIQKSETKRAKELEANYRQQLTKLQQDLDSMLHQHQQVIKLKNEVENGLQLELDVTKRDLKREKEQRQNDKDKFQKMIRELNVRIRELEMKLADLSAPGRSKKGRNKSVTFLDDEAQRYRTFEERHNELRRENDAKIANLVRHFEKEKTAALEIFRTKVKAEISLLIPRIKEQCHRAYSDKVRSIRGSLVAQFREEYEAKLGRMKNEHALERKLWQRQTRDLIEQERAEIIQKLKAKYELKVMEIRNDCERRILQRLRNNRQVCHYNGDEDMEEDNSSDLSFV